jgi:hypothetical protein
LCATTYVVTNTSDSGPGSFRQAILDANAGPGGDTITFDPGLAGSAIVLGAPLPPLGRNDTTLEGDLNQDSAPDIALNGAGVPQVLEVSADGCVIEGLAIHGAQEQCLVLECTGCRVYACHLGVNLAGTARLGRTSTGILILGGGGHWVGGAGRGNIFATRTSGVQIRGSGGSRIAFNHFGVNRLGTAALGQGGIGVTIANDLVDPTRHSESNSVSRNVFGGLDAGVQVTDGDSNTITGNLIGLSAGGSKSLPIASVGVSVAGGGNNLIGGPGPRTRNVFAGGARYGVYLCDGTQNNRVVGNWFGTNATGSKQKPLQTCLAVSSAGPQQIGGSEGRMGNFFCPLAGYADTEGIVLSQSGGSLIRHNTFGILPNGRLTGLTMYHIIVNGSGATLRDNVIAKAWTGLQVGLSLSRVAPVQVYGNTFQRCEMAIDIQGASRLMMGDLGNSLTTDDGGNVFAPSNTWFIVNHTTTDYKAEGNTFPTTSRVQIDYKIIDQLDDPTRGRIDFDPLAGGVSPTGSTPVAMVSAASAAPTPAGAEIAYTLSAPASVTITVRNLAGRPIATVVRDRDTPGGLQRTLWSGSADNGLRVPAGAYMVEIAARSEDGGQGRALTTVRLGAR